MHPDVPQARLLGDSPLGSALTHSEGELGRESIHAALAHTGTFRKRDIRLSVARAVLHAARRGLSVHIWPPRSWRGSMCLLAILREWRQRGLGLKASCRGGWGVLC